MPRVLVTEPLAESGLALLREAGHDVDVQLGLSPDELLTAIKGASALIVRSATKVTADVFDAATSSSLWGAPARASTTSTSSRQPARA